ncbi:MAG: dockerin type I repeat-containing protein [Candidatus Zixiibacteriota bacterium]
MLYRVMILFLLLILVSPLAAINNVYMDIVETGEDKGADTLFVGKDYEVRLYISNDVLLGEIRLAPFFRGGIVGKDGSKAGHFWEWVNVEGYGTIGCVRFIPGSRMYPPETVWDDELDIFEWNMDEDSPDTIGIRGVSSGGGLPPGPGDHMISIHFTPKMPSYGMVTMWADTATIPPTGALTFFDTFGTPIYPTFTTASPWPIMIVCGDANGDGSINVGDAVHLINYIFKGGDAPAPVLAGDASCDGSTNIGDAVYLINFIFKGGPAPCCPPV